MDTTDPGAGISYYTEALMGLIETYVSNHGEIDTDRIYIGGCSNGGYMTVNMLTAYPEYFAAAFPVCEAYEEAWLDDEKIARLKNIPIWMTAAKSDRMVLTENHSSALYNRLVAAGAQDIRYSLFENVVDTSGKYFQKDGVTPYEYQGHWSWIYTLNNECVEETDGGEISIFEWLAQQSK
ncbi:MAG: prolyl oligopeptidase family serine peptidase [Hungatella sp.]|nr:prolyl oligopeptidase family serine peptidase [Hungatella sp.]